MTLPVTIPNTFANATASIPLANLDANFVTIYGAVNGIGNGAEALSNVTITGGNATFTAANATTVDATNVEVTNIKAKDGTAAGSIADSTGVVTLASSVLTTTDINGGTIDATAIGGSTAAAGSFTTLNTSGQVVFNDAGADVDFRVEGDTDANLLFVDASADRVGIGTNAPTAKLSVDGSAVFNESGANVDFRVEGDSDANLLFVDASVDRVGIGTSAPARKLEVKSSTSNINFVRLQESTTNTPTDGGSMLELCGTQDTGTVGFYGGIFGGRTNSGLNNTGYLAFYADNNDGNSIAERARITSLGFFKASDTGTYNGATDGYHELRSSASGSICLFLSNTHATNPFGQAINFSNATPNNTSNYFLLCSDPTNSKAIIFSNGDFQSRTNSYGGISDVKLKQDIVDANSQWDDIKGLRIRKYRFKDEVAADPNYPSHLGVIAQEAEIVSPGLVFESPDFENVEIPVLDDEGNPVLDEEGNPQVTTERQATGTVTKGVKYSILYMKAVKALQEAIERIETLEAKVAALETK